MGLLAWIVMGSAAWVVAVRAPHRTAAGAASALVGAGITVAVVLAAGYALVVLIAGHDPLGVGLSMPAAGACEHLRPADPRSC